MFTVTEGALEALYRGRVDAGHRVGEVMRLTGDGVSFRFKLDAPGLTDLVYRHKGEDVLLVAASLNRTMGRLRMGVVSRDGKRSFVLERA